MKVRCKFRCHMKDASTGKVSFHPVYSGSKENEEFFKYTPAGEIAFWSLNKAAFDSYEVGKEYYFDSTPAS